MGKCMSEVKAVYNYRKVPTLRELNGLSHSFRTIYLFLSLKNHFPFASSLTEHCVHWALCKYIASSALGAFFVSTLQGVGY